MQIARLFMNAFQAIQLRIYQHISYFLTSIIFKSAQIKHRSFKSYGLPYVHVSLKGNVCIGENFTLGNSIRNNATGVTGRCKIDVRNNANLIIGNNVGITLTTITCFNQVRIDDNVKIGFGTHIMDTDFHSIDPAIRSTTDDDVKTSPIHIKRNAFIGAHCFIMKGVTIGENSIVGAGSVVTKSIPDNEIWGGNPAKFLKTIRLS